MPEAKMREPALVRTIKDQILLSQKGRRDFVNNDSIREKIAPLYPETEFVGKGSECIVIGHKDTTEKVVAFNYNKFLQADPMRAIELYHFHRLFSSLFPHNFPRFSHSSAGPEAQTVRAKVTEGTIAEVKYPFQEVIQKCDDMGIPIDIDSSPQNFLVGVDGGEYYLDSVMNVNWDFVLRAIDTVKLNEYLRDEQFTPEVRREVHACLARLRELRVVHKAKLYIQHPEKIPQEFQDDHSRYWERLCDEEGFRDDEKHRAARTRILKTVQLFAQKD